MNIKNGDVVNIVKTYNSIRKKKMPVRVGFAISRNISILTPILEDYEKNRLELLNKYCKKNESGEPKIENGEYILNDEDGFKNDMVDLINMENDIVFYKISITDLEKCDEGRFDTLTLNEIESLYLMIE